MGSYFAFCFWGESSHDFSYLLTWAGTAGSQETELNLESQHYIIMKQLTSAFSPFISWKGQTNSQNPSFPCYLSLKHNLQLSPGLAKPRGIVSVAYHHRIFLVMEGQPKMSGWASREEWQGGLCWFCSLKSLTTTVLQAVGTMMASAPIHSSCMSQLAGLGY